MKIVGLQKMTLLDYPGKVGCTVFLEGCNFRCPFCHNSQLLGSSAPAVTDRSQLLAFLSRRKGLLDGVCVTGGEPTLSPDLPELLREIRAMGFSVKLDTNGSRPQVLRALVEEGLVDYVAMDIKNAPSRYAATCGTCAPVLAQVEESLRFLVDSGVDYELRTTLVSQLHNAAAIEEMGAWLKEFGPVKRLFLQSFVDRETVPAAGLSAPKESEILVFRDILSQYIGHVEIRGMS